MLGQVTSTVAVLALACNVATAFMAPAAGRVSLKALEARTPLIAGANLYATLNSPYTATLRTAACAKFCSYGAFCNYEQILCEVPQSFCICSVCVCCTCAVRYSKRRPRSSYKFSYMLDVVAAGNWKENPCTLKEATDLTAAVAEAAKQAQGVDVAVFPSFPFIQPCNEKAGSVVKVGGQVCAVTPLYTCKSATVYA
jgi:Triosephosphate isomerase